MGAGRDGLIKKMSTPGGEAERQWRDNPGANWLGPMKPGIIPNARKQKPQLIPNSQRIQGVTGKYT